MAVAVVLILFWGLYLGGLSAFGVFVAREEKSDKAVLLAIGGVILGTLLALFSLAFSAAVMVAACFYVADRKNRSRGWAIAGMFLGPIALLVLVFLPRLSAPEEVSLTSPTAWR